MRVAHTDNGDFAAKLELRRHFLRTYHQDEPIHVFDCCQGEGRIWKTLRSEFEVASYWGVDLKPKPGRMRVDSARVLATPGLRANVVDADTYGQPWTHWMALLPNVKGAVSVFMTWGQMALSAPHLPSLHAIGIPFKLPMSPWFGKSLRDLAIRAWIWRAEDFGLEVVDARQIQNRRNGTAYFAARIRPR